MFYVGYVIAELRRRRGRTLLTALGLGVGVGLVVTVTALSHGLDRAQSKVLKPLTGVGTDMSVKGPAKFGRPPGGRLGLRSLGKPGQKFERDDFIAPNDFADSQAAKVASLPGAKQVAAGLTVTSIHVSGVIPKQSERGQGFFAGPAPGGNTQSGPRSIDFQPLSVAGVDETQPDLGAVTRAQLLKGAYFSAGGRHEAILDSAYARRKGLDVGEKVTLAKKRFRVIGIARSPLGGQSSDIYVKLAQLQKLASQKGRANTLYVRATDTKAVGPLANAIRRGFPGAQVTTSKQLADRVGGSLVDVHNLSNSLGTALEALALLAAFLIASLLTLSSVTKRVRELGTLKALGWRQRLVVRQVAGESLAQGALGGIVGAAIGIGGAALITAIGPTLTASVAQAAAQAGPGLARAGGGPGPGPGGGPGPVAFFGQGQVTPGAAHVALDAPIDLKLVLLAVGLAIAGGLVAGIAGGLRTARLRPADALRHID